MSEIQLPLTISLKDDATFENYFSEGNEQAVFALRRLLTEKTGQFVHLWGDSGVGASHLLQAVCHEAHTLGVNSVYFPLKQLQSTAPEQLFDYITDAFHLVCLDDLDIIAGQKNWERALFDLYNRMKDTDMRLLVASQAAPKRLGIQLPDLESRLYWSLMIHLSPLSEAQKLEALHLRAQRRGLCLQEHSGEYLLRRCEHSTHRVFTALDQLDQASLAAQRRITKPFIREILETAEHISS